MARSSPVMSVIGVSPWLWQHRLFGTEHGTGKSPRDLSWLKETTTVISTGCPVLVMYDDVLEAIWVLLVDAKGPSRAVVDWCFGKLDDAG